MKYGRNANQMKKIINAHKQAIEQEVNKIYDLKKCKPNGFGDNMYHIKNGILLDMFEKEEESGSVEKDRQAAFILLAEEYETMGSWN